MKDPKFFAIPKENAVYKVQEDCCYEKVVYDGPMLDICSKNDAMEDGFNSWDLLCYSCNAKIDIIPTTEEYYNFRRMEVNSRRAA